MSQSLTISMNYYQDGVLKTNTTQNFPNAEYKNIVEVQKALTDALHSLADKRLAAEAVAQTK